MSAASSTAPTEVWARLSPSCQSAFAWALSLDPGTNRKVVYSENLLLGLIHVHPTSNEPELLLGRFGQSLDVLERTVQSVSTHHQQTGDPALVISDLPDLSQNTRAALEQAVRLAESGPKPDGVVHAPQLFGGILTQSQSYAFRALQAALGGGTDLGLLAQRYIEVFLKQWPGVQYSEFLSRDGAPPRETVEWVNDSPATVDTLDRRSLAIVIAQRLERMNDDDKSAQKTFLVHIDGPWGSGKSTLLEFLRAQLTEMGWLVVPFDAWRQSRVGLPWWSLLMALRRQLPQSPSGPSRLRLWLSETWQRTFRGGAPYLVSIALLLVLGAGLFLTLRPSGLSFATAREVAESIGAVIATLVALWAGAFAVSRFLLWDSPLGARLYEQSQKNPMEGLAVHFAWLLRQSSKPVAFFVDDLDRCDEKYVVDLLDSVQTLIRDSPTKAPQKPYSTFFIVAADGAWLRRSYEMGYDSFGGAVGQPGRSLGYLFLDKIFQLTVPIPFLQAPTQTAYLEQLLNLGGGAAATQDRVAELARKVRASATRQEAVRAVDDETDPEVRRQVAALLVERVNAPAVTGATEHELTKFAQLLEPNPRAMKRFLNTFALADSVLLLQDIRVGQDELALWTILRLRWPVFGDYLRARPEAVESVKEGGTAPADTPADLVPLFTAKDVIAIVGFTRGGPLDADKVRRCSGMTVDSRVLEATVLRSQQRAGAQVESAPSGKNGQATAAPA